MIDEERMKMLTLISMNENDIIKELISVNTNLRAEKMLENRKQMEWNSLD